MKIPLFDLDKTLISSTNSIHDAAFRSAFLEVFHAPTASTSQIVTSGKIDSQILCEVLALHDFQPDAVIAKLPEAFDHMAKFFSKHINEKSDYTLMPGAMQLLEKLSDTHTPLGILTGNVESIAQSKLKLLNIDHLFSFGAFGNLALRRAKLVPIAHKRALAARISCDQDDLVIIGDTPLDVACALEAEIEVIGVAAGNYSVLELQNAGANLVIESLEEAAPVLDFLSR